MKNIIKGLLFILFLFTLVGCTSSDKECEIYCDDIAVMIGDTINLDVTSDIDSPKYTYKVNGNSVSVKNGVVTGQSIGESKIVIGAKGYSTTVTITAICGEQGLLIKGENTVIKTGETTLKLYMFGIDPDEKVVWKSSDKDVAHVLKGVVSGLDLGNATITATSAGFTASFDIEVIRPAIKSIEASNELTVEVGAKYAFEYYVLPEFSDPNVEVSIDNDNISMDSNFVLTTKKEGSSYITLTSKVNSEVKKTVKVNIIENAAPVFEQNYEFVSTLEMNFGEEVDILKGIIAKDNADGDITNKITYDKDKLLAYGTHPITLSVTDLAGNTATMERMVTVNWPYKTKFIGHAGCYYGVANTEEAFLYAAKNLHYQAIECDLHSTKDNVFVTNHDSYLTIDGNQIKIAETNYEDLIKYELTYYNYTGHVCTLERYLEICKEYGCEAIIELKWSTGIVPSNQSRLPALVQLVKDKGMWDNVIFLSDMQNCLTWFRTNGYNDVRLQYLVQGADSLTAYNYCVKNNIDISVNVTYGQGISDEYIKKYHDAGLEISTWTFSGKYEQIQEWIDKGVEYVTTDLHDMSKLEKK